MRLLAISIIFSVFAFSAQAEKRKPTSVKQTKLESVTDSEIKNAKFSCGVGSFKLTTKSQDARVLMEIFARKSLGVDVKSEDDFVWRGFVASGKLPGADEEVSSFGITDEIGFSGLIDGGDNAAETAKLSKMIKNLKKQKDFDKRYIFAFGGGTGGSVCGVTWPGPILIDLYSKKIYDFTAICGDC